MIRILESRDGILSESPFAQLVGLEVEDPGTQGRSQGCIALLSLDGSHW